VKIILLQVKMKKKLKKVKKLKRRVVYSQNAPISNKAKNNPKINIQKCKSDVELLLEKIENTYGSDDKIRELKKWKISLTSKEAALVIKAFPFSAEQEKAGLILFQLLKDPHNVDIMIGALSFHTSQAKVKKAITTNATHNNFIFQNHKNCDLKKTNAYDDVDELLKKLKKVGNSFQIEELKKAHITLTCKDAARVIKFVSFPSTQEEACIILFRMVVDPSNVSIMLNAVTCSSNRDNVKKALNIIK